MPDVFDPTERLAAARRRAKLRKAGRDVAEPNDKVGAQLTAGQRAAVNSALTSRKSADEAKAKAKKAKVKAPASKDAKAKARAKAASAGNYKARVDQTASDVNEALAELRRSQAKAPKK